MSSNNENMRNSKPISLYPLKPEDAIRGALLTAKLKLPKNECSFRVHDIKVRSAEGQVKLAPRGATP